MNFVKKNLDKIWYGFLILVVLVLVISNLLIAKASKNRVNFLTILDNYSISTHSDNHLDLMVYCNRNDTMYTDQSYINEVYLIDYDTSDKYAIQLEKIEYKSDLNYQNENYYGYIYQMIVPFSCSDIINLNNCYLNLHYNNDEVINLKIGSMGMETDTMEERDLVISKLKGLVTTVDDELYLAGIYLEFLEEALSIIDIIPISPILEFNLADAVKVSNCDSADMKDYIESYQMFDHALEGESILIDHDGVIIPLSYQKKSFINNLGFIIIYEQDGVVKKAMVEPFCFFKTSQTPLVEVSSYDFN